MGGISILFHPASKPDLESQVTNEIRVKGISTSFLANPPSKAKNQDGNRNSINTERSSFVKSMQVTNAELECMKAQHYNEHESQRSIMEEDTHRIQRALAQSSYQASYKNLVKPTPTINQSRSRKRRRWNQRWLAEHFRACLRIDEAGTGDPDGSSNHLCI